MNLWKFNKITGYWDHQRKCDVDTSKDWLIIYQHDEPNEIFKLAKNRPKPFLAGEPDKK